MKNNLFFFLIILICFSCKNDAKSTVSNSDSKVPKATSSPKKNQEPLQFIVNIDRLRLRAEPGEEGEEVAQLVNGTVLTDLGTMSDFTTKVKLRGIQYDEPWIKVRTSEGQEGWVYGGAIRFEQNGSALANTLLNKRLHTFFGQTLTNEFEKYRTDYKNAKDSKAMAKVFSFGNNLRDKAVEIITNKIEIQDHENLADLFWMREAMPGYVTAMVAEGTTYYLFRDYKQLYQKASTTDGSEDDAFMQLGFMVHAMDSVEHFFPEWFMQTWDYGGHSKLGEGIHHKIFKEMSEILDESSLFATEINDIKIRMINDITNPEITYWQAQDKILKELTNILTDQLSVFSEKDLITIKARKKMFEDPKKHKIKLNYRAG